MKEFNKIIATNLVYLRKKSNLTQLQLAEKLNYSDKAISKWETGETMPDIEVLFNLTKMYGVTLDFLTTEHDFNEVKISNADKSNKIIITSLSTSLVWIIATIAYVYIKILQEINYWQIFIWSVPISTIVLIIFNGIWGSRKSIFILVSILTWSILASFYLTFLSQNLWLIFIIGIPFQIAIILWSQLKRSKKESDI